MNCNIKKLISNYVFVFNQFSKKYNVARDILINTALLVLREAEINQIEAKRDVHTKALKEINNHLKISEKTFFSQNIFRLQKLENITVLRKVADELQQKPLRNNTPPLANFFIWLRMTPGTIFP